MQIPPHSVPMDPWDAVRTWRWYVTRLVRGGPEVAAELRIVEQRDRSGELLCDQRLVACINGEAEDVAAEWPPMWPWRAVDELTFRTKLAQAEWAKTYRPSDPLANPRVKPDLSSVAIPF